VDETVIVSDTEPNRILALSFWNGREDAQRYEREQFDTVQKTVQHLLETHPWFGRLMSTLPPPTGSLPRKPPEATAYKGGPNDDREPSAPFLWRST
jgi:hypothetical protein